MPRWEKPWRVPTTAAIGRARRRLGPEPLKRYCASGAADPAAGSRSRAQSVRRFTYAPEPDPEGSRYHSSSGA
ncbi:hypothetical protein [Streptomyces sp. NPDC006971]|uniref:hypothetical protein n=1 Tax=Streptomyces sp. NPDC006971 TaxID=3154784 RepID=UPI00340DA459